LSNASDIINGDVGGEVKPNDIVADDGVGSVKN
jgi:hypothetical protein